MSGIEILPGVSTKYPQINENNQVVLDDYITVDTENNVLYFLGEKYILEEK